MHDVAYQALLPLFLRATLKSWESGPGDEATLEGSCLDMGLRKPRECMKPYILVRESNTQLLRYSLDTWASFSAYLLSQKRSIEAWNSSIISSSIML